MSTNALNHVNARHALGKAMYKQQGLDATVPWPETPEELKIEFRELAEEILHFMNKEGYVVVRGTHEI